MCRCYWKSIVNANVKINIDLVYAPTGLKKNGQEKVNSHNTNIYALSIVDRYENGLGDLESLCLVDVVYNCIC